MSTIQLPIEFSELLKSLNGSEVKYLVVGGYAVAYHGYPRTTGDIDIWIDRTEENAMWVVEALRHFGFDVPELYTKDREELFGHLSLDEVIEQSRQHGREKNA